MATRESAYQARWKFLLVSLLIGLAVRTNNFVNGNESASPEVFGSFLGAATGGLIIGWIGWWAWSTSKK